MITLSPQQLQAVDAIERFLQSGRQLFALAGHAGTGKTTILTSIALAHPEGHLCAFTGKAASVLNKKSGLPASTVHSLIYQLTHKEKDEDTGKTKLFWRKTRADGMLKGHLILLDESSMISQEMGADLINSGATIIACGDPGQLPPVFGKQAFPEADFMLTEIHRQAAESPIIRQATSVRTTGRYVADTDAFQVVGSMSDAALMDADVVLCWKNATRNDLNLRIRALLGLKGIPKAGEPVLCLKNAYGLFNGGIYTLARNIKPTDESVWLMINGDEIEFISSTFVKKGETIDDYDEDFGTAFDWGYVVTCHKSQGSEWPKVVVIDEYRRSNDRAQWLYTALTRAADSIIVQQ